MRVSVIEGQARPAMAVEIKLGPVPESVPQVREFVRTQFIEWGFPKGADDAALIADELACNAIAAAPDTPFLVSLRMSDGSPMLEVADCSPEWPVARPPDFMAEQGRGMHIVTALSVAWDSYPVPGGKVVWVQLRTE